METRNWGWIVARGVVAVLFGLVAFFRPAATWLVLMTLFAAYALIDGIASLVTAMKRDVPTTRPWWWLLIEGASGIGVAVLWLLWPLRTALAFLYVIGAWGVVTGAMEIASAIRLRHVIRHE